MAFVIKGLDRVQETTTGIGTGPFILAGAVTGFDSFATLGNGNSAMITIAHDTLDEWITFIGTYTAVGTSIAINTVHQSSNGDALVTFSAGDKFVFVSQLSNLAVSHDSSGNVAVDTNLTLGGTVDGRDVAADGTKLDGIESSADVTDATNVDGAGAAMNTDFLAKGSILAASAASTPVSLAVGPNDQVLTADSLEATGIKWAAAAGGGMSIGGAVTGGTTGSVLFVGAGPVLSQNNANIFWDDVNLRLGIGTGAPFRKFHISDNGIQAAARVYIEATPGLAGPGIEFAFDNVGTIRSLIRMNKVSTNGAEFAFFTKPNGGSLDEMMRLNDSGGLSLGRTFILADPGPDNLTVEGVVGIGTGIPDSMLEIFPNATGTQALHIKQRAGQTAQLVIITDSSDNVFFGSGDAAASSEVVWNEQGIDIDFRVEGVGQASALFIQGSNGSVGIHTNAPDVPLHVDHPSAATNIVTNVLKVTSTSTGTPANGIGVGMEWEVETAAGNNEVLGRIDTIAIDVTALSEDGAMVFSQMVAGSATLVESLRLQGNNIGFYGATAVVQASALTAQDTSITHTAPGVADFAIQNLTSTSPFGFVTQNEGNTVLQVILNLQTRVAELEAALDATTGVGLIA